MTRAPFLESPNNLPLRRPKTILCPQCPSTEEQFLLKFKAKLSVGLANLHLQLPQSDKQRTWKKILGPG